MGSSCRASTARRVDFPQPLGPVMASRVPGSTRRSSGPTCAAVPDHAAVRSLTEMGGRHTGGGRQRVDPGGPDCRLLVEQRAQPARAGLGTGEGAHGIGQGGEGVAEGDGRQDQQRGDRCRDRRADPRQDRGRHGDRAGGGQQEQEPRGHGTTMALAPGRPAQVRMGGGQPGLRPPAGPDGLELAGIAGHQGGDAGDLGTGVQQGLLGARLQPPAEGEDGRCGGSHGGDDQAGHGREGRGDDRGQDALATSADRTGTVTLTWASTTSLRSSTTPVSRSARPRRPSRAGVSGMSRSYAVVRRPARSARATSWRAQALPVAEHRPGQAEGAHGHDRGEQHEDDGPFAGADDQPAGGGGQGDARCWSRCRRAGRRRRSPGPAADPQPVAGSRPVVRRLRPAARGVREPS